MTRLAIVLGVVAGLVMAAAAWPDFRDALQGAPIDAAAEAASGREELEPMAEPQRAAGADTRPVILALGDSLTAGFGVPAELSYPAQLERQLESMGYLYRVVNLGVSGSTTTAGLSRLHRGLMLQPEVVILQFGGNDAANRLPLEVTRDNLRTMIDVFRLADARVILAGRSLPRSGPDAGTLLTDLAEEEDVHVVSGFLAGVAGNPELLLSDGSHPNGEGYSLVVRNVLEVLEPLLREARRAPQPR